MNKYTFLFRKEFERKFTVKTVGPVSNMVRRYYQAIEEFSESFLYACLRDQLDETRARVKEAVDFGTLSDPNEYGKWVSIKRHNQLMKNVLVKLTQKEQEIK